MDMYGTLDQLAEEGYIDPRLAEGELYGYRFTVRVLGADKWEGVAVPSMPGKGGRAFFIDETGLIRFSADGSMPNRRSPALR